MNHHGFGHPDRASEALRVVLRAVFELGMDAKEATAIVTDEWNEYATDTGYGDGADRERR